MEELDFLNDIFHVNLEEENIETEWKRLIEAINEGKVIPVIGSDFLVEDSSTQSPINLHRIIIDILAKQRSCKPSHTTFSSLINDRNFENKDSRSTSEEQLVKLVEKVIKNIDPILSKMRIQASSSLRELLSTKRFPFVITTSFTPIVERIMKEVWGNVYVKSFNNDPNKRTEADIISEKHFSRPTVFYMFGKSNEKPGSFVLTDKNMLNFCASWLNEGKRPTTFSTYIKDKYLLILGNDYSDWLFRFIWFSLRTTGTVPGNTNGLYAFNKEKIEDTLQQFLDRNHTFMQENPKEVVKEIVKRIAEINKDDKFNQIDQHAEVFISYSRRDSDIAASLYERLTDKGVNVWYDKKDLTYGGKFKNEIKQAIENAEYFIPILTRTIEKEKREVHVYREEWEYAINKRRKLGYNYIIPVSETTTDFYNSEIPDDLKEHNAIMYDTIDNLDEVVEKIMEVIDNKK